MMSMRKKRFGIYLLLSLIFVIGMSAQVVLDNWGQQDREGRNIDVGFQNHKVSSINSIYPLVSDSRTL